MAIPVPTTTSPVNAIGDVFETFRYATGHVAGSFAEVAPPILGAFLLIMIIKDWMESTLGGHVSLVESIVTRVIWGGILLMAIQSQPQLHDTAWALMGSAMELMNTAGSVPTDGSGVGVLNNLWDTCLYVFKELYRLQLMSNVDPTKCDDGLSGVLCNVRSAMATLAENVLASIVFIVVVILVGIYLLVMMLQVFTGIFMIGVGLAFLPLVLAFYPVVESWTKNVVGLIASGIAHMGIVAFLLSLVGTTTKTLVDNYSAGLYDFFTPEAAGGSGEVVNAFIGKSAMMIVLALFMLVMAFASAKAIGFATSIFGSVGGMMGAMHAGGNRGGGGGGGGQPGGGNQSSGGGGDAAAAGAAPSGGGAAPAGSGGIGNTIRTGASAALAVKTGGASMAGSGAAQGMQAGAGAAKAGSAGSPMSTSSPWRAGGGGGGGAGGGASGAPSTGGVGPGDSSISPAGGAKAGASTGGAKAGASTGGAKAGASTGGAKAGKGAPAPSKRAQAMMDFAGGRGSVKAARGGGAAAGGGKAGGGVMGASLKAAKAVAAGAKKAGSAAATGAKKAGSAAATGASAVGSASAKVAKGAKAVAGSKAAATSVKLARSYASTIVRSR